ncbi:MAG: GGDEF domain-containing protein [Sphingobium sp.]|nr:MAG: GGDEF domain-containing protein [Sphingobium sp.]
MNSHLPVGRLASFLDSLSREQTWFAIVAATAGIAFANHHIPEIGFAPLYIPVICGACWGLGAREGYFVAVVTAILAASSAFETGLAIAPEFMVLRTAIRIGTFVFIAATITSFRRSYDRELFLAHRDRMTGTLNKEVFHRRCAEAIEDAGRAGQILMLALIDLDDFKAVNSAEGHRAGDEVLRAFAKGASSIVRREDLIGRIGGDEFALLVRVPSIAEGQGIAHDVHARLSAVLTESQYPVTCSMGALLIPPEAPRNAGEFLHAADEAMYRAKRDKNAVEIVRAGEPRGPMSAIVTARPREGRT